MKNRDLAVAIAKGTLGAIPIVGSMMAEIVGHVIPNQRLERLEAFATELSRRLDVGDEENVTGRLADERAVDLLEDAMLHASRALSDERRGYIAEIVKTGLTKNEFDGIREKFLLALLSELNDAELIILQSYGVSLERRNEFYEQHKGTLHGPLLTLGSSREEADESAIHGALKNHLFRLGLLKQKFKNLKKGEIPEFDEKTGMMKTTGFDITPLGRLLLRTIGLECWP